MGLGTLQPGEASLLSQRLQLLHGEHEVHDAVVVHVNANGPPHHLVYGPVVVDVQANGPVADMGGGPLSSGDRARRSRWPINNDAPLQHTLKVAQARRRFPHGRHDVWCGVLLDIMRRRTGQNCSRARDAAFAETTDLCSGHGAKHCGSQKVA